MNSRSMAITTISVANPYGPKDGRRWADPIRIGVIASWSLVKDSAIQNFRDRGDNIYKNPTTGAQSDDVISWQ